MNEDITNTERGGGGGGGEGDGRDFVCTWERGLVSEKFQERRVQH